MIKPACAVLATVMLACAIQQAQAQLLGASCLSTGCDWQLAFDPDVPGLGNTAYPEIYARYWIATLSETLPAGSRLRVEGRFPDARYSALHVHDGALWVGTPTGISRFADGIFQDAVAGPISYDLISLFKDAFLSWPEARVLEWLRDYHRRAAGAGLPVPEAFDDLLRWCDLMGAQRHLKVIGIFARIRHRDGKPKYLEDAPRFFAYLSFFTFAMLALVTSDNLVQMFFGWEGVGVASLDG